MEIKGVERSNHHSKSTKKESVNNNKGVNVKNSKHRKQEKEKD